MGGLSGGSTQQATQTTTNQMSPQAQELVNLALPNVRSFAGSVPPRWPGSTVAPFDPMQQHAQENLFQMTPQQQQVATRGIMDTSDLRAKVGASWEPDTLNFDRSVNPMLDSAIKAAQQPTWDQLMEQTLPGIRDTSVMQGYGGSRQGIAEGLAIGRAGRNANDIGAKMAQDLYRTNVEATGQRYGQNVNALLGMAGMAPMQQQTLMTPGLTMSNIGDVRQSQAQAELGGNITGFNYDVMAPFLQAQDIIGLTSAFPGSSTTVANQPKPSPFASIGGGALAGAGLGSMFGPVGGGIGAGLGGLAGLLFS